MNDSQINRRHFLQAAGGFLAAASYARIVLASADEPATRARAFLASLFDPELKLLPEYPGSKVYWLYHDNYLAPKVLAKSDPARSEAIVSAIRRYGVTGSGKIEILFHKTVRPLPFRHYRLDEEARVGEKVIRTEVAGDQIHEDLERYADLLFMDSIAEVGEDRQKAEREFEAALKTWDGTGIRDRVNTSGGLCATYRLFSL